MSLRFSYSSRSKQLRKSLSNCQSNSSEDIDPQINTDDDPQNLKPPSTSNILRNRLLKVKQQKAICKRMPLAQSISDNNEDKNDMYQIRKKIRINIKQKQAEFNADGNTVQDNFKRLDYHQSEFQCHDQVSKVEPIDQNLEQNQIAAIQNFSHQHFELDLEINKTDNPFGNQLNQQTQILLQYNLPKAILEVLDGQSYQELFQQDLKEICDDLELILIRIYQIDIEQEQIYFQILGYQLDDKLVNVRIQNCIIDQLRIYIVDPSIHHLHFQENIQNKDQLEQEFKCYIHVNQEQRLQYVTLNKYKDQIQQAIELMDQKQIKKKIEIKQKIIFQKLEQIIQNTLNHSQINIEFNHKDKIIQLYGYQLYVDKVQSEIKVILNNLEDQIQILRISVSDKQWKMLEIKQKDQLQQIMDQNSSFYDYSDQTEKDKQVVANLRINNKLISIQYGQRINQSDQFQELNNHIFRTEEDFSEQQGSRIQKIFQEAEQFNKKSITIPILTGEQSSLLIKTAYRSFLTMIITLTKKSQILNEVLIIEMNSQKLNLLVNQLKDILYPIGVQEQLKNQNEQDNQQDQQDIQEFSRQPPTHELNLLTRMITDIKLNIAQHITYKYDKQLTNLPYQYGDTYLINGRPVSDSLNQYIKQQFLNGTYIFNIFLDQNKPILNRFDFKIEQTEFKEKKVSIDIKSLDASNLDQVKLEIDNFINNNQVLHKWKVLNLKMDDLIEVEDFIINNSFGFEGEIKAGNEILIRCSEKKLIKIQKYLINILREKIIYPEQWDYQEKNFVKIRLNPDGDEYKQVEQKFIQGYSQGIIYQINRIQNKQLYENFINEQNRLLAVKQNQRQTLTKIELNRSLWHGVKFNHPSIIYESDNEAFKSSLGRINAQNGHALGSWGGPATYFAEKSLYSKVYSYQLKPEDSVYFQGKLVCLLCQVTTGICGYSNPNTALREPPAGYDCVIGKSHNSQIFVLYGMASRRAYPFYEVIFE